LKHQKNLAALVRTKKKGAHLGNEDPVWGRTLSRAECGTQIPRTSPSESPYPASRSTRICHLKQMAVIGFQRKWGTLCERFFIL
jgi:hypothetical protein